MSQFESGQRVEKQNKNIVASIDRAIRFFDLRPIFFGERERKRRLILLLEEGRADEGWRKDNNNNASSAAMELKEGPRTAGAAEMRDGVNRAKRAVTRKSRVSNHRGEESDGKAERREIETEREERATVDTVVSGSVSLLTATAAGALHTVRESRQMLFFCRVFFFS